MNNQPQGRLQRLWENAKLGLGCLLIIVIFGSMALLQCAYSFDVYTECRQVGRSPLGCAYKAIFAEPVNE